VVLVWWVRPRVRRHPSAVFFSYIGLYSVGRFFIEALRLDSFWIGSLRVPQLASVAGVLVAVVGLLWALRQPPEEPGTPEPATGTAPATRGRRRPG
jgi:phosphatidylglycerol:prolipoprotein diacylglycerol transferase